MFYKYKVQTTIFREFVVNHVVGLNPFGYF